MREVSRLKRVILVEFFAILLCLGIAIALGVNMAEVGNENQQLTNKLARLEQEHVRNLDKLEQTKGQMASIQSELAIRADQLEDLRSDIQQAADESLYLPANASNEEILANIENQFGATDDTAPLS